MATIDYTVDFMLDSIIISDCHFQNIKVGDIFHLFPEPLIESVTIKELKKENETLVEIIRSMVEEDAFNN